MTDFVIADTENFQFNERPPAPRSLENDMDCSDYSIPESADHYPTKADLQWQNQDIVRTLNVLRDTVDKANIEKGWRDNYQALMSIEDYPHLLPIIKKYVTAGCLALIHSEISEALEGDRKDLMDDHLPHRPMIEVELADAIIRIMDLAGMLNLDIGGAVMEKHRYNQHREDHKRENRARDGGKKL